MDRRTQPTLLLHEQDNVAVALWGLEAGAHVGIGDLVCQEPIPAGHKVAIQKIGAGEPVRKYGQIIGSASADVPPGYHVHTHNVVMGRFARDYAVGEGLRNTASVEEGEEATFQGIVRGDGRVGTRNYIGILSTVNCSASVARFMGDALGPTDLEPYPNVDGIVALGHGTGCSMVPDGEGFVLLQRTLAGYARHPNFAGVILVGLGCEVNQVGSLLENMDLATGSMLRAINVQEAGGTRQTVAQGAAAVREMLSVANQLQRETVSARHLMVGLECGGSDAYSGISANPALGEAVDILVRNGGTAILSETPEIYGAEHLLTRRAGSREVAARLIDRVRWWEQYTKRLGGEINNNPTPGNRAGGLTTILEKSLGAAAKGGTTNLVSVYDYAEPVTEKGLVFMDTPGYDAASVTGMIAGGANLVCFTTGRGSVSGFKPVPTLKLATHSEMYRRLEGDMDVNCGLVLDGKAGLAEMGQSLFQLILETASGRKTKSEALGFGDNEFVPWQIGPVL
jgi:altronate hydrolase